MTTVPLPFAIYHEHPDWFRPLFAEFERRGLKSKSIDPRYHSFDPSDNAVPYSLLFNRMSPSAYLRDGVQGMFYTSALLAHWERIGLPVINGSAAFAIETSKAKQLSLLQSLGLSFPKSRVVNHVSQVLSAAQGLRFPIVVKANIGGSGAGITKFDTVEQLAVACADDRLNFGIDYTALVQEFTPARDQTIIRVETLAGKYLYAIQIQITGESFNLCPADICQRADGVELARNACPIDAPKTGMRVAAYQPPQSVIDACESIMQTAKIDVGGIEYMIDDRDGRLVYYDINALSNFVADAVNVIGFDPFSRLVDYLETVASRQVRL